MTKIALDVESVLADTNEAVLQSTDAIDRDELLGSWDFSDEQWQVYMGVSDAVWRHAPETVPPEEPNIDQYVSELNESADVDIVTARQHVDEQLVWWLDEHNIEYDTFVSTDRDKWELDGYDVYIDDNPEMFGNCRLLLRHQNWNRHLDDESSKQTDRIHSLAEATDYV